MRCSFRSAACARLDARCAGAQLLVMLALVLGADQSIGAQTAPGAIRGTVTDSAGTPLQGATIRIANTEARRFSDAAGRFLFERVTSGRYQLTATMIGARPANDSVVVAAGETTQVRFALRVIPFVVETLPPHLRRGDAIDTAPVFAETTDPVARVARLPRLRPTAAGPSRRELRLWKGFGIGIPMQLVRVTVQNGRVQGEVWHWVQTRLPDASASPQWRAFMDSLPMWLQRDFRCGDVAVDTLRIEGVSREHLREIAVACRVRFRSPPDWNAFLAELEKHHVWSLPDESELPQHNSIVNDGVGLVVEAWDSQRYRSYHFGNPDLQPSAEARDAQAILTLVRELVQRDRPAGR
jgi:hypothetical protein